MGKLKTYDEVRKSLKESLENNKEWTKAIVKYHDDFITWLIGFAVTGMYLIVFYFEKLPSETSDFKTLIFLCLFVTLVFGTIYRLINFKLMSKYSMVENFMTQSLTESNISPLEPMTNILESENYIEVYNEIQDEFDTPFQNDSIEFIQKYYPKVEDLKNYYISLCDNSKRQLELAFEHFADAYQKSFKIPKQETINTIKTGDFGFDLKLWSKLLNTLFYTAVFSFIGAIFLITLTLFMSAHIAK